MRSLLTDASLPAPPRLGPPVKGSAELLEASVSVVDARREEATGRSGLEMLARASLQWSFSSYNACVCVWVCVFVGIRCVCVSMSAGVSLYRCPLPCANKKHESVEQALMCLWVCGSIYVCERVCVCVCMCLGEQEECALSCTPTAATRLATCSGIREHADYTRHNGDTQTQICPRPTKDTHTDRTTWLLIAFSIFNIFVVWEVMTLDTAHDTADDVYVYVDWSCEVRGRDLELCVFGGFIFSTRSLRKTYCTNFHLTPFWSVCGRRFVCVCVYAWGGVAVPAPLWPTTNLLSYFLTIKTK